MTPPTSPRPKASWLPVLTGAVWLILYFVARGLLKNSEATMAVRVAIALAPVPAFAAFLWQVIRGVRSADEFERRIHLEALAVAYPLAILLLMTLGLLQRAITLKFEDWSYAHVWIYLPLFYFLGLALARRRYA